jgi:hypothetical protein
MVDVSIATGAEQPINRFGAEASETLEEGDFVALEDVDGDGQAEVVKADVTNGRPAVGVAIGPVADPDSMSDELNGLAKDLVSVEQTVVGQRIAYVRYGVELEDTDAADNVYDGNYGEPVLLTQGVGSTDAKYLPEADATSELSTGDVRQVVGFVKEARQVALEVAAEYGSAA